MKDLNLISQSVVYLEPYAEDPQCEKTINPLGHATAFIWKKNDSYFLVSNWHVFTGKNHDTGKKKLSPKYFKISSYTGKNSVLVKLYDYEDNPLWLQDRYTKTDLENVPVSDIAILPLKNSVNDWNVQPLNISLQESNSLKDIVLEVTTPMSIVGYPLDVKDITDNPPLWVTANVASPPLSDKPSFLANGFPYSGMSGSPVFWIFPNRPIKLASGAGLVNSTMGEFIQFVGIYSGRMCGDVIINDKPIEQPTPLARIWNAINIDNILIYSKLNGY